MVKRKFRWWWNEEVAEAVREKRESMEIGKKEKLTETWKEYRKSRENAKRVISLAKGKNRRNMQVI